MDKTIVETKTAKISLCAFFISISSFIALKL